MSVGVVALSGVSDVICGEEEQAAIIRGIATTIAVNKRDALAFIEKVISPSPCDAGSKAVTYNDWASCGL
jgi:hypothetical protein